MTPRSVLWLCARHEPHSSFHSFAAAYLQPAMVDCGCSLPFNNYQLSRSPDTFTAVATSQSSISLDQHRLRLHCNRISSRILDWSDLVRPFDGQSRHPARPDVNCGFVFSSVVAHSPGEWTVQLWLFSVLVGRERICQLASGDQGSFRMVS